MSACISDLPIYNVAVTFKLIFMEVPDQDGGPVPPLPGKSQNYIECLINTVPNPLENHKAINVGPIICPPAKHHLNGISVVGQ